MTAPRRPLIVFWSIVALHALAIVFLTATPRFAATINGAAIAPELGKAYVTPIEIDLGRVLRRIYFVASDSSETPQASPLRLFENDQPLGPPHSVHVDIRDLAGGRYSHWLTVLIFSASDGSDPRANGRRYTVETPSSVALRVKVPLIGALLAIDIWFQALILGIVGRFLRAHAVALFRGVIVGSIGFAALAAFNPFGRLLVDLDGPAKGASLVIQIAGHVGLGVAAAIALWAAGGGLLLAAGRRADIEVPRLLIPAFPLGLVLIAVLVAAALMLPYGRAIATAAWALCVMPLVRWRPPRDQVKALIRAALMIVPLAGTFGAWLALLWHGPTATIGGSAFGDLSFYAGGTWTFAKQFYPYLDLAYANGPTRTYFNMLFPALGATLIDLPGFDPHLFLLAAGGTMYVLLTAIMGHLYAIGRRCLSPVSASIFILGVITAARYPYWVVESIPLVFTPTLALTVWWMSLRGRASVPWSAAATIAGVAGSALSKTTSAAVLGPIGVIGILVQLRKLPRAILAALILGGGVIALYAALMLSRFLPEFAAIASLGPESWRIPQWYFLSRDLATGVLLILVWIVADRLTALALSIGFASFLAFSFLFHINFVIGVILIGAILLERPTSAIVRTLIVVALLAALPAAMLSDPVPMTGYVWVLCLGGAVAAALFTVAPLSMKGPQLRASLAVALTICAVGVLVLVGAARGSIVFRPAFSSQMPPEVRDIWDAVRRLTPDDVLIFTDQVDETIRPLGGWNTYALRGQRQIFLSSYYTSQELRTDLPKLRSVLAVNTAVLDGTLAPKDVATRRHYDRYFAVVSSSRHVPPGWRKLYSNDLSSLYEILP